MKFNDLSIQEKAAVIKLGVGGGLHSLLEIQLFWDGMSGDTLEDTIDSNEYKKGGSIHIKPENRGKFTALKKRTGHSASWFKEHGTPALRKMATFALNARKWHKHAYGGPDDPPKKRFKTPEEILTEKYGIEPMVMDNVVQQIPVVTQAMKNEYASTPLGIAEEFGTIGTAENTNAFQRKVREIRNSDNPMWFGAYFVPYLGLGMLLSNAAERFMSGQYGLGLFDTGLAFAPYLSKTLKPFIRNTRKAFEFNVNPANANSGIRTEYPWLNWNSTTELSPFARNYRSNINPIYNTEGNVRGWQSIDGNPILEASKSNNVRLLKQPVDNPFVDANGNINEEAFKTYMNQYIFGNLSTNPVNKFNINLNIASLINKNDFLSMHHPSPLVHGNNVPVIQHMIDVAKSAQLIPLPSGIDKQSMVTTALFHDIGELLGRENHGLNSANILRNELFISNNPLGNLMLDAITNHMKPLHLNEYNLLLALRAADASRGVGYQESRLRWPSFYNYTPLRLVYDSSKETALSNIDFMNRFNEYFAKYGNPNNPNALYPLIQTNNPLDTEGINKQAKDIIARHNTFIRGVRDFKYKLDLPDDIKQLSYDRMRELGLDPDSRTDRINFSLLYYVPETGSGRVGFRSIPKWNQTGVIYTSNSLGTGAGYGTSQGTGNVHNAEVALVRRPYKLGEDRNLWMQEGDFVLRGETINEGPYYNPNEYSQKYLSDKQTIRDALLKARLDYEKDPEVMQLEQIERENRNRERELIDMRRDALIAWTPENMKKRVYDNYQRDIVEKNAEFYLNNINRVLNEAGMQQIKKPNKTSAKLLMFYKNLDSYLHLNDFYTTSKMSKLKDNKGWVYNAFRKSKVTPQQMKFYGHAKHEYFGDKIADMAFQYNLLGENHAFNKYIDDQKKLINGYLWDLERLYNDMYIQQANPNNSYVDLYNLPKNDELSIYTSEGIFRPDDPKNTNINYLHYLFPGPAGEKALDLVRWIDKSEWVNNPNLKVTRGHNNIGGYPEATLKTFDLGGPIKPFSYLPIPEVRY